MKRVREKNDMRDEKGIQRERERGRKRNNKMV